MNHLIFKNLDLKSQINWIKTNKKNNFHIDNLYDFYPNYEIKKKINDNVLQKYKYLKKLNIGDNQNIKKNLNHLINLKILNISELYNFKDSDICELKNLKVLIADNCPKITTVNNFKYLESLYAGGNSGINQEGIIENKNLKLLFVANNSKICNVNHLTNLKFLNANNLCGITDEGVEKINPLQLFIQNNKKIKKISHMTNLKLIIFDLNCPACEILQNEINNLKMDQRFLKKEIVEIIF